MSERTFRFILGTALLLLLYFDLHMLTYVYIGMLLFEGITNWRIPILISRLRYGKNYTDKTLPQNYHFKFEAERGMRLVFALVLTTTFYIIPEKFWFINWLISFALFLSGMVNFCPVVFTLRRLGFR